MYIDLHVHLDGSISVSLARRLAEIENIPLPSSDTKLKEMLTVSPGNKDLNEYLTKFDLPCALLQSGESIRLAVFTLCKELEKLGLMYAEIRFAPQKHTDKGLPQAEVVQAAIEGLSASGFFGNLILCCMRGDTNQKENEETITVADKFLGKGVCALDLAGAEGVFPNDAFFPLFQKAKERGIPFTIHAGEALGADSVEKAISFGARRIGHGVRAIEDERVVELLCKNHIPLEICPTSNINTGIYSSVSQMPVHDFLEKGVVVTVNSDNMTVSETNVIRELSLLKDAFLYTDADIKKLLQNACCATFLPEHKKELLLEKVEHSFKFLE